MKKTKLSLRQHLNSYHHAFNGLWLALKREPHMKIHFSMALIAIILGLVLHIGKLEWGFILLAIFIVITSELFNSAIEELADRITMANDSKIRAAKDMAAAAVLVSSIGALFLGCLIFLPKIFNLLSLI